MVIAALIAAFGVSPAAAGTTSQSSWACDTVGFSSLSQLAVSSTARGDVRMREPDLGQVHTEAPAQRGSGPNFSVTVPTWVHVVSDGAIGNVSNRAVRDQIRVLDMTFGGFEGGVATGFDFELVGITRTDNAEWHYASFGPDERDMKRALHRGGDDTLNIYLTTAGPISGGPTCPTSPSTATPISMASSSTGSRSVGVSDTYEGRYDQGETATHEAGHWLNLEHTFYGGCNDFGDFVADTPPERTPTSGCPVGKDTCPEPGLDPIHNYMDYSYDQCYTEFTAGQADRMQDAWLFWRAN